MAQVLTSLLKDEDDDVGVWTSIVNLVIRPPRYSYNPEEALGPKLFVMHGTLVERHDLELTNNRGHTLKCSHYVPVAKTAKALPCVVYCHGNCGSRVDSGESLQLLLPQNISVFSFDFSGSGLSDGELISLGYYEKSDLGTVVRYLRQCSTVSRIGLWGRSMGGATCLLYSQMDPSVAGMVVDSSFVSLSQVMMELATSINFKMAIPKLICSAAIGILRRSVISRAGFDIEDVDVLTAASRCYVPTLFAHASGDDFVLPEHSRDLHEQHAGDKRLLIFPGNHNSVRPSFFYEAVSKFFRNVLSANFTGDTAFKDIVIPPPDSSLLKSRSDPVRRSSETSAPSDKGRLPRPLTDAERGAGSRRSSSSSVDAAHCNSVDDDDLIQQILDSTLHIESAHPTHERQRRRDNGASLLFSDDEVTLPKVIVPSINDKENSQPGTHADRQDRSHVQHTFASLLGFSDATPPTTAANTGATTTNTGATTTNTGATTTNTGATTTNTGATTTNTGATTTNTGATTRHHKRATASTGSRASRELRRTESAPAASAQQQRPHSTRTSAAAAASSHNHQHQQAHQGEDGHTHTAVPLTAGGGHGDGDVRVAHRHHRAEHSQRGHRRPQSTGAQDCSISEGRLPLASPSLSALHSETQEEPSESGAVHTSRSRGQSEGSEKVASGRRRVRSEARGESEATQHHRRHHAHASGDHHHIALHQHRQHAPASAAVPVSATSLPPLDDLSLPPRAPSGSGTGATASARQPSAGSGSGSSGRGAHGHHTHRSSADRSKHDAGNHDAAAAAASALGGSSSARPSGHSGGGGSSRYADDDAAPLVFKSMRAVTSEDVPVGVSGMAMQMPRGGHQPPSSSSDFPVAVSSTTKTHRGSSEVPVGVSGMAMQMPRGGRQPPSMTASSVRTYAGAGSDESPPSSAYNPPHLQFYNRHTEDEAVTAVASAIGASLLHETSTSTTTTTTVTAVRNKAPPDAFYDLDGDDPTPQLHSLVHSTPKRDREEVVETTTTTMTTVTAAATLMECDDINMLVRGGLPSATPTSKLYFSHSSASASSVATEGGDGVVGVVEYDDEEYGDEHHHHHHHHHGSSSSSSNARHRDMYTLPNAPLASLGEGEAPPAAVGSPGGARKDKASHPTTSSARAHLSSSARSAGDLRGDNARPHSSSGGSGGGSKVPVTASTPVLAPPVNINDLVHGSSFSRAGRQ